jgi:hypothetical protein
MPLRFGACLLALTLVGCSNLNNLLNLLNPSNGALSGNYTGTIQDSVLGAGLLVFSLTESGSTVTGTYSTQFPAGTISGSISGTVNNNGASLSATLTPSASTVCSSNLNGTISSNSSNISGSYAAIACPASETGSFNVTN